MDVGASGSFEPSSLYGGIIATEMVMAKSKVNASAVLALQYVIAARIYAALIIRLMSYYFYRFREINSSPPTPSNSHQTSPTVPVPPKY